MNYQFDKEHISQHIVKYGVDIRPTIGLEQEKTKLQDYCNALIEQFPRVFETLIAGPKQLRIHKTFVLPDNKRAEMPTFVLTARGPLFTFPQRLYIDGVQDIDIDQMDKIFRKALDELRAKFIDRTVPRVGVVNEIIFDTGRIDSLQVLAGCLKNDLWRQSAKNLHIRIDIPTEDKNISIQLRPTQLRRIANVNVGGVPEQQIGFGIIVNVDINNREASGDLTAGEIRDIVTFADDYVPEELIRFLNNEY